MIKDVRPLAQYILVTLEKDTPSGFKVFKVQRAADGLIIVQGELVILDETKERRGITLDGQTMWVVPAAHIIGTVVWEDE